ncbi:MAG: MvdC family ATP-grasp ribosomal peptide maturase [Archangium sp.]|nr:MvdC family ATP-grasp ribosomal peptide maturase [Archangium sp.]
MTRRRGQRRTPLALLVTHSADFFTVDRVALHLKHRGWQAHRLDTDTLAAQQLTVRLGVGGASVSLRGTKRVALSDARAVWLRRLVPPALPPMPPRDLAIARDTWFTTVHDALALLGEARWVNPLRPEDTAESKLHQLQLARALGFTVPETLVTNTRAEVAAFRREHGRIITKLLIPRAWGMQASDEFFFTREVTARDVAQLERIRVAPQIFQPLIEKARELRVHVVGEQIFVAAIDARDRIDWRVSRAGRQTTWTTASLPRDEVTRVRAMLKALGLVSGAFDFIETPEGQLVLLEVNPAGEWGWLERDLGFNISGAITDALTEEEKS